MASWSAFGIGGIDPIGSIFEQSLNNHFERDMARFNSGLSYDYYLKSLRESPKAQREGLELAGFNPLLAVMNGSLPSAFSQSSNAQATPLDFSSEFDVERFNDSVKSVKQMRKRHNAEIAADIAGARSEVAQAELEKRKADLEKEALDDIDIDVKDKDGNLLNPTHRDYKLMIRNGIQQSRYRNSREHSIFDDVGDWTDRITSFIPRMPSLRSSARQQSFDNGIRSRDAREKTALRRLKWKERNRRLNRMR